MLRSHSPRRRRGATLVEAALVYPTALMLLVGVIVVGLGVFRVEMIGSLAREGARYASVRGAQFATDTGNAAATNAPPVGQTTPQGGTIGTYVRSKAAGLDPNALTVTTTWNTSNSLTHSTTTGSPPVTVTTQNTVSVTVSYTWVPEAYWGGFTMSSTSVMPMSY